MWINFTSLVVLSQFVLFLAHVLNCRLEGFVGDNPRHDYTS